VKFHITNKNKPALISFN